jgi:hypothetical protein
MSETFQLSLDTIVRVNPEHVSCTLDGETVLMSIEAGDYYYLNDIGSNLWAWLATPRCIADLCASCLDIYEIEPEQCRRQVLEFLNTLYGYKLIQIVA